MSKAATRFAFLVAALGSVAHASDARAADGPSPSIDFPTLLDRGSKWLRGAAAEAPRTREDAGAQPLVMFAPPRAAVLVRDWRGSMRVSGDETVTDQLRPSASYRMGVVRASSTGRLAAYVQLGAGQWRLDPVLFPGLPCDERLTGQVGGGLQLRASGRASIGAEALYNVVYREPADPPAPRFLTLMVAARATF